MAKRSKAKTTAKTSAKTTAKKYTAPIEAAVKRVLADDLYWFPVRHHSPAAARHVHAAIIERKPKVVFIEGPPEANELVKHLVDSKTKPPVAIYSSYRDDDNVLGLAGIVSPAEDVPARFASWYPLLDYSPEYVAMQAAKKIKATVRFIDLAHYAQVRPHEVVEDEAEGTEEEQEQEPTTESEPQITEAFLYDGLARAAGFDNWSDAWESLFEFGEWTSDREAFRYELAMFCAAARDAAPAERLQFDGTLERERAMRVNIAAGLKELKCKRSEAMVVCGGFHLFMDHDDMKEPPPLPAGTVYASIVPYSFYRTSELSGYRAGNRAPKFYQTVWKHANSKSPSPHARLIAGHAIDTLKVARKRGAATSAADAIAVTQHARMLAALRGRARPILQDLHDAIITCCCKGDPNEDGLPLKQAMDEIDIGNRIGTVTPKLGRLPLVRDFYQQLETCELQEVLEKEKRIRRTIDKREPSGQSISAFLHRLRFLEIPLASPRKRGSLESGTLFREEWSLKWSPDVEPAVIEKNMYGDTVESAAMAMLGERLASSAGHAGQVCRQLRQAVDLALPDMVRQIEEACREALEIDTRFISLGQAITELTWLHQHATYAEMNRDQVWTLLQTAYLRACFAIPGAASVPEEEQAGVVNALRAVAELVLGDKDKQLDHNIFIEQVRSAEAHSTAPFLQGAFVGMLAEMRAVPPETSGERLALYAQEPPDRLVTAGDFLHGMLAVSKTSLLIGADGLVAAIDQLLAAADWEHFLIMLPRMRLAFTELHERQRVSFAERVARSYGLTEGEQDLTELQTSVAAAAVFARIDAATADLMKSWDL